MDIKTAYKDLRVLTKQFQVFKDLEEIVETVLREQSSYNKSKAERDNLSAECDRLSEKRTQLEKDIQRAGDDVLEKKQKAIMDFQEIKKKLNSERTALNTLFSDERKEKEDILSRLKKKIENQTGELKKTLDTYNKKIEEVKGELDSLRKKLS